MIRVHFFIWAFLSFTCSLAFGESYIYQWPQVADAHSYEGVIWTPEGVQIFQTSQNTIILDFEAAVHVQAITPSGMAYIIHLPVTSSRHEEVLIYDNVSPSRTPYHPTDDAFIEEKWETEAIQKLELAEQTAFEHPPYRFVRLHNGIGTEKLDINGDDIEFAGKNSYSSLGLEFFMPTRGSWGIRSLHNIHIFTVQQQSDTSLVTEKIQNRSHSIEFLYPWWFEFAIGMHIATYPKLQINNNQTGDLSLHTDEQKSILLGLEWPKEWGKNSISRILFHHIRGLHNAQYSKASLQHSYLVSHHFEIHLSATSHLKKQTFSLSCPQGSELSICNTSLSSKTHFNDFHVGFGFHF